MYSLNSMNFPSRILNYFHVVHCGRGPLGGSLRLVGLCGAGCIFDLPASGLFGSWGAGLAGGSRDFGGGFLYRGSAFSGRDILRCWCHLLLCVFWLLARESKPSLLCWISLFVLLVVNYICIKTFYSSKIL